MVTNQNAGAAAGQELSRQTEKGVKSGHGNEEGKVLEVQDVEGRFLCLATQ